MGRWGNGITGEEEDEVRRVRVLERDGDLWRILLWTSAGDIEAIARVTKEGDTLMLRNLDIGGPGPGSLGRGAVGELRSLVRELEREESVEYVRIESWIRRTGAGRGRMTRPIIIEVDT